MTKISNNFIIGSVNKDLDERLVPVGQLTDAVNISILTSDEGQKGVAKNALGNVKKSNYLSQFGILNATTIGKATSASKYLLYNFVCGSNYDAIIEYNSLTNTSEIVVKSTSVTGSLNFSKSHRVKGADVIVMGEDGGDLLAFTDGYNPPRIINIQRCKSNNTLDYFTKLELSVIKPPPSIDIETELKSISTQDSSNFIRDKFISFAYRYKYNDGYYSAISSWTEYCFLPKSFDVNYFTLENDGMENTYNAVTLSFNTGERDVISIDLIFRESGTTNVYVIDSFVKEDEGWDNNTTQDFTFVQNKIYKILPEAQYFRNFDNVPLIANAQTVIGSRLLYGNFTEGRDLGVVLDYNVELVGGQTSTESAADYTIEDYVLSSTKSNIVDFSDAGNSPIGSTDYLNRSTNIFTLPPSNQMAFLLKPFTIFDDSSYTVRLVNADTGVTIQEQGPGVGIPQVDGGGYGLYVYSHSDTKNVAIYVTSNSGTEYSFDLEMKQVDDYGDITYRMYYNVRKQFSLTKSPGYLYDNNGNVIKDGSLKIDFSGFNFTDGLSLLFNFNLTSYYTFSSDLPTQSYSFVIPKLYSSLSDFYTNSGIKEVIENVTNGWSYSFKQAALTSDGTLVDFTGFTTSIDGNFMIINLPYQSLDVDDGGVDELKYEFFKINSNGFDLLSSTDGFFKSLHSNRDYEVAMIYMDAEGRKTTALVDSSNAINVPASRSDYINLLQVTTIHNPPVWADRYKFAIKQVKKDYETIYANSVFEDDNNLGYRWLKLEGQNINKVKTGDELIVKSDDDGPLEDIRTIVAIEVKEQIANFIPTAPAGLYLKIQPKGVSINEGEPIVVLDSTKAHNPMSVYLDASVFDGKITPGSRIKIYVYSDEHSNGNAWSYDKPYFISNANYDTLKDWYESVFPDAWGDFDDQHINVYWENGNNTLRIQSKEGGYSGSGTRYLTASVTFLPAASVILETVPQENTNALYYETPKTYKIVGGEHNSGGVDNNVHRLRDAWNCFCWGNGAESYKIKDNFNAKKLIIDFNPTAVSEDKYRQINRFADLTYSEVLQESTNVNRLNEFNLYLANYKDDMQKSFGKIVTIKGFDTNVDVLQEDKYSVVYYGKDLLFNADGSTNLQKIPEVLGQQKALDGEFGNQHSDAFDFYGYNRYFPDLKRGTIMAKYNNGLVPIANYGMNYYFTRLFRDNTINNIIGAYDQHLNTYIINIKYNGNQFVTWFFADESNGWVTSQTFNPEDMVRLNGEFYSFYQGEVYRHNDTSNYNTFYGEEYPSSLSFNMNIEPGTRKVFRTLSTEGTDKWDAVCVTELQKGGISKNDFQDKEGVKYGYIRGESNAIDTATPSVQGVGVVASISGNNVITNHSIPSLISVGDKVYNSNQVLIGTITNILSNGITLNTVTGLNVNDFIFAAKGQEVETSGLLGYYMNVTLSLSKNTRTELYQVNSEVSKSFM
jgi:hypothetical protein